MDTSPVGLERGSGILCHLTSLPSRYGIGDLGPSAYRFVDLLAEAGQRYWQFLPLGPCSPAFAMSPYMALSAFAGNPLLISLEILAEQGLLTQEDLAGYPPDNEYLVEFDRVRQAKARLFERAYGRSAGLRRSHAYERFCVEHRHWLDDYACYMALRRRFRRRPWSAWPEEFRCRRQEALAEVRRAERDVYERQRFLQFCFFSQWQRLREHARQRGVLLVGDLPIYVGYDSADVWALQECYRLGRDGLPTHVAGVPPDYFSATGQRWGNPLYRWHREDGNLDPALLAWWRRRFAHNALLADAVRIDHFRAFAAYWEIPAGEPTAVRGRWVEGPGEAFFTALAPAFDGLAIIAEDLGVITREVTDLRRRLGFPGMRVLQFAFDSDEGNAYLPHNYGDEPYSVVYTGTHDNDTAVGWYLDPRVPPESKARLRRYANSDGGQVHWDFIRLALGSVARLAILPLQDVLGFGSDCRMNTPGTATGNWRWRCAPRFLGGEAFGRLAEETRFYNRWPVATHLPARP